MNRLTEHYEITYQNDIQHSYMVIKLQEPMMLLEYQIRMIQENPVQQLLSMHKKRIDKYEYLYFDITSKITLGQLLKRRKLKRWEFLLLIKSLIKGLELSKLYLLQGGSFILLEDYIYVDPVSLELSLAYIPVSASEHTLEDLKVLLIDLIVYKASFETSAEGSFAYEFLETVKGESFGLKQLTGCIHKLENRGETVRSMPQYASEEEAEKRETDKSRSQKPQIIQKAVKTERKSTVEKDRGSFLLVQLFFAAGAIFLFRLFYYSPQNPELSTAIGVVILVAACDYLLVTKLKLWDKKTAKKEKTTKKKAIEKINPIKQRKEAAIEAAFAKEPEQDIHRGALETELLIDTQVDLVVLESADEEKPEKIYIDKPSFVVGRLKTQVDWVSDNNAVGKLHAELIKKEGVYYIKDLNSKNGTYINGERIASNEMHPIKDNDRIAFANSEYRFICRTVKPE